MTHRLVTTQILKSNTLPDTFWESWDQCCCPEQRKTCQHGRKGSTLRPEGTLPPPCGRKVKEGWIERHCNRIEECMKVVSDDQCESSQMLRETVPLCGEVYLLLWLNTSSVRIKKLEPRSQVSHCFVSWRVTACTHTHTHTDAIAKATGRPTLKTHHI